MPACCAEDINEQIAGWTEQGSDRAIDVLGVLPDGRAELDVSGDGVVDEPPGLNISDAERQWLGTHYAPASGQVRRSLWRVPIRHFTDWDANMGTSPEAGAVFPTLEKLIATKVKNAKVVCNSVIECKNRALGESLALPGVGASLHDHSTRTAGWGSVLRIPLATRCRSRHPVARPTPSCTADATAWSATRHPSPAAVRRPPGRRRSSTRCRACRGG